MPTFTARYPGRCAGDCGKPVEPGQPVQYVDDELVHAGCQPVPGERPAVVCPACWLTKPCDCEDDD